MKTTHKTKTAPFPVEAKPLTLGDLVAATYSACGAKRARKILHLALDTQLVRFRGVPFLG